MSHAYQGVGAGLLLLMSWVSISGAGTVWASHGYGWSVIFGAGAGGWSECTAVGVDPNGDCYLAGRFRGRLDLAGVDSAGGADVFVSRLLPDGSCQWIGVLRGQSEDLLGNIALDQAGNLYVGGAFRSQIYYLGGPGGGARIATGYIDGFVCRFLPEGKLVWLGSIGGPDAQVSVRDVCTDLQGNVYATGVFSGKADFDPGPGEQLRSARGYVSTFVTCWDPNAVHLWTAVLGGPLYARGTRVRVGGGQKVYVAGIYNCPTDFDPGPGVDLLPFHGDWDVFLSALAGNGDYLWTRNLSGSGWDLSCDLAIGPGADLLLAGGFSLLVDMDPGSGEDYRYSDHQCVGAGFVGRWTAEADYRWTWTEPRPQIQQASVAVAVGTDGTIYTLCEQILSGLDQPRSALELTAIDPNGRAVHSTRWDDLTSGITGEDDLFWPQEWGLAVGPDGSLLIAGRLDGCVDMDPGPGSKPVCASGGSEGFVIKLVCAGLQ